MSPQSGVTQRDLNVKEAWAQGYTGHGIVVSILDDGIEKNHPDLAGNYVRRWGREAVTPGEGCPAAVPLCQCGQTVPDDSRILPRIPGPALMSTTRTLTPSLGTRR